MLRSFSFGKARLARLRPGDPRVLMRAIIGVLLLANLAAAVIAIKPFGGSAADLRGEQANLNAQLASARRSIRAATGLVDKMDLARREGDQFLDKYIIERRLLASTLEGDLASMAKQAGIRPLPSQTSTEDIEGSDTLQMVRITAGFEGNYASLKKLLELLDKSPRMLIVESMTAQTPQTQQGSQVVNVVLTLDAFARETPGAKS
jgi:hypothetical protein